MALDLDRTKKALGRLVATLHDSQENFRNAAERAESSDLKLMLMDFAIQRARFAGELQNEIIRLGDPEPPDAGTIKGSVRRTLMKLKTALASDRDRALLAECERGEDAVIAKYQESLQHVLPRYIREMLESQIEQIGASRAHLARVEETVARAS
jgi:uncharacterized protein (TIGR02284 family)